MKKIFTFNNIIYYNLSFLNGNLFYGVEYLYYLNKKLPEYNFQLVIENKDIVNIPKIALNKNIFFEKIYEKYNEKINEIIDKIHFVKYFRPLFIKNLIILDQHSILHIGKFLIKNIFFNWGDHERSRIYKFKKDRIYKSLKSKNINIIDFGDKDMNLKVTFHEPLKLNFDLFKEIKKFKDDLWYEYKDNNIFNRKRNIKNFHRTFNKLIFEKNDFWERANRLIPECKFYNKEIEFINHDNWIDSADLRYERPWYDYDIKTSKLHELIQENNSR